MIEQTLVLWGFGLLAAALVLVIAEVFVPSGGMIGIAAFVSAIAAVVAFWRVSWVWGTTSLLLELILAPVALSFALRIMPHTPVGRRIILADEAGATERQAVEEHQRLEQERALIGAVGVALTDLRPVGSAEIDGTRIEVLAEGGVIEAGRRVRVTGVQGKQVKVRAVV